MNEQITLESFINFCEDMEIVEEGFLDAIKMVGNKIFDAIRIIINTIIGIFRKKKAPVPDCNPNAEPIEFDKERLTELLNEICTNINIVGQNCAQLLKRLKNILQKELDTRDAPGMVKYTKDYLTSPRHRAGQKYHDVKKSIELLKTKLIGEYQEFVAPIVQNKNADNIKELEDLINSCTKSIEIEKFDNLKKLLSELEEVYNEASDLLLEGKFNNKSIIYAWQMVKESLPELNNTVMSILNILNIVITLDR